MNAASISIDSRPRTDASDLIRTFQQLLIAETLRNYGGKADLVLVGDSLIQNWQWDASWQRIESGRKVLNFGLGGDRTENLSWRLEQGLLDGLSVSRAALLIGINNAWEKPHPSEIVKGISHCVRRMRKALPRADILVYGLFPLCRRVKHLDSLVLEVNRNLPSEIGEYGVTFHDIGGKLRTRSGVAKAQFMHDGCHLTEPAYQIWTTDLLEWLGKQNSVRCETADCTGSSANSTLDSQEIRREVGS